MEDGYSHQLHYFLSAFLLHYVVSFFLRLEKHKLSLPEMAHKTFGPIGKYVVGFFLTFSQTVIVLLMLRSYALLQTQY